MKYTKDYNSEDLTDSSSLLSIYDDVLFNHTIGDYKSRDLFTIDDSYDSDDAYSFDDDFDDDYDSDDLFSIDGEARERDEIEYPHLLTENFQESHEYTALMRKRCEKNEAAAPTFSFANLTKLHKIVEGHDDYSDDDDDLSIESQAQFSRNDVTYEVNYSKAVRGLSSRVLMPQYYFPSYKDVLMSRYFFV